MIVDQHSLNHDRIQPSPQNPFYWQYKGELTLLLGGSVEDNLFQIPDLEAHLDLLASVGGNYVRCTMSSRDEGDVWPFVRDPDTGLYDLNQPGGEYWERFERFLQLASARDIIAQIELWDRFDFSRDPWQDNPYNPQNNINYTAEQSGLKPVITTHPGRKENAFFRTMPALDHNEVVLQYQHKQVTKMLSISLRYGNVLYCMDNETNESPEWGWYWAKYIQAMAKDFGVGVECTEMWDSWNLLEGGHAATFEHPEIFSFVDISQNNHQPADHHWENPQEIRQRFIASGAVRPMNSVKIYGANSGRYGSTRDAQERFWRNIFGGLASSRFHRPASGLGLNQIAQAHIKAMRMLTDELDIFTCAPHNDLLQNRSWNEAYCAARIGSDPRSFGKLRMTSEYAVFFPDGGNVLLDVAATGTKTLTVRWLDIRDGIWLGDPSLAELEGDRHLRLVTPTEEGYWAALVKAE
jgi:hypothetical protein